MTRFQWGPGTIKVDWAFDGLIPWQVTPPSNPGTVHLADSVAHIAATQTEISSGQLPDRPFLVIGQMASADGSRAPTGAESAWAYTHLPQRLASDRSGIEGTWDDRDKELMAQRMERRIEEVAPGFVDCIVGRRVNGPREFQHMNENLHHGALNGGTANAQQQLIFRPVPGRAGAETPIRHLYLASASAHPGGGVHGACGANAARAALAYARLRKVVPLAGRVGIPSRARHGSGDS
jgi:phytoene dehydrogenase-like protein